MQQQTIIWKQQQILAYKWNRIHALLRFWWWKNFMKSIFKKYEKNQDIENQKRTNYFKYVNFCFYIAGYPAYFMNDKICIFFYFFFCRLSTFYVILLFITYFWFLSSWIIFVLLIHLLIINQKSVERVEQIYLLLVY